MLSYCGEGEKGGGKRRWRERSCQAKTHLRLGGKDGVDKGLKFKVKAACLWKRKPSILQNWKGSQEQEEALGQRGGGRIQHPT